MADGEAADLHLPLEICSEILTRVPIKSILRFRSVCKSWHSLISSPDFKPETLADRIILNRKESRVWSLTSLDESFLESRDLGEDLPDRFRGQRFNPIGSCDGLICLYNSRIDRSKEEDIRSFLIHNPAIRKTVELPCLSLSFRRTSCYYGFGFDSKASDYKVMLVSRETARDYSNEPKLIHLGFMFDLRNGVWREFTPILPKYWIPIRYSPEFYLNGALHWVGFGYKYDTFILSFSMSDETFRVISTPAELNREHYSKIMTSRGLVYAIVGDARGMPGQSFSVWVMKEYGVAESWTRLFSIDMPPRFWPDRASILTFWIRGPRVAEVILSYCPPREVGPGECVEFIDQHLILHNNESGESKCLLSTNIWISSLVFYKESLVLM